MYLYLPTNSHHLKVKKMVAFLRETLILSILALILYDLQTTEARHPPTGLRNFFSSVVSPSVSYYRASGDNKVTKVLRRAKSFSGAIAYQPSTNPNTEEDRELDQLPNDKLLKNLCPLTRRMCSKLVDTTAHYNPKFVDDLGTSIKERPENVSPRRVLAHKLFEAGVDKSIDLKLDHFVNEAIDTAVKRSPYGFLAGKVIDYGVERANKQSM